MKGLGGQLRRPEGWFGIALLVTSLVAAATYGVRPLATYRALAIGADELGIGLIAASFALLAPVAAVPLGDAIQRHGERMIALTGCVGIVLSCLVMMVATDLWTLAATQVVLGLGQLSTVVAVQTLIVNVGDPSKRDQLFGYYSAAASLGHVIGPAGAGFIAGASVQSSGADASIGSTAFFIAAMTAAAAAAAAYLLPGSERRSQRIASEHSGLTGALALVRHPNVLPALLVSGGMLAAIDVLVVYVPVLGEQRELSIELVGLLIGTMYLATILARMTISRMIVILGRVRLLATSLILPCAVLPILSLTSDPLILGSILAIAGFGLGLGQPLSMTWVSLVAPPALVSMAMGIRMATNRMGQIFVPAASGLVAGATGTAGVFIALSGLLAISAGLVWRYPPPPKD